ncbi:MAG: hypothetical protein FD130_914 [Halothiobacillaceae bacterium]|nr:MAG: hypothetical protein FD130_914 [Halothiobacillaceae bacterium]
MINTTSPKTLLAIALASTLVTLPFYATAAKDDMMMKDDHADMTMKDGKKDEMMKDAKKDKMMNDGKKDTMMKDGHEDAMMKKDDMMKDGK